MARIRTIKPEFWADEKMAPLPPIDRLVFLGLIGQADDAGRLVDNPRLLDGLLFPMTEDRCGPSLDALARLGRIVRYTSDSGQPLIQITNWKAHQRVQKPSAYVLPGPTYKDIAAQSVPTLSGDGTETVPTVSGDPPSPTLDLGPTSNDLRPRTNDQRSATAEAPRAHTSEPAREAAPSLQTDDSDSDEVEAAKFRMRTLVELHANGLAEPMEHTRFMASAGVLVSGADSSCWKNPRTGSQVPWEQRPQLLEVAIAKLVAGERDSIRAALTLAIQQQVDPFPVRTSPVAAGSEAAQVLASGNELPQSSEQRNGRLERTDGFSAERAELEEQQRIEAEIGLWERTHPEEARRILLQAKAWADTEHPGNPARSLLVPVNYRQRVRAVIENQPAGAGAAQE